MIDERKPLTDYEVKAILERIPMTERLAESERAEMKDRFLRAMRQVTEGRTQTLPARPRPLWWIGFGATAAAFATLAVFFLESGWGPDGTPGDPRGSESITFDEDYFYNESHSEIQPADPEVTPATADVKSATEKIQVNQVPWESLCGPRSIWFAAARSGINLDLGEVIQTCRVRQEGCSLWDLKRAAESFGFKAEGKRLNWDSLLAANAPTVLLVEGNHFACVDPSERSPDGSIRYYDPPISSEWVAKEDLLKRWNGESLVLTPPSEKAQAGPSIKFETVVQDLGDQTDTNSVTGVFTFLNQGDEPLEIVAVNHSCGCLHTEVTKNPIPPGESAEIMAEMALQGVDGARSELIEVQTNDPANPSVTLVLQAKHERTLLLSQDFVDFGIVTTSQPSDRQIILEDRSREGVPILDVAAILEPTKDLSPEIEVLIEEADDLNGVENRVHLIRFHASASAYIPLGSYQGKIRIVAGEEGERILEVAFQMTIESDYLLTPPHISFGVVREGEAVQRSLVVLNRAHQPVRLVDHKIKYDTQVCSIRMTEPSRRSRSMPIDLSLSIPDFELNETTVAKGALILQPENGPELEVPWSAIVKKGH